MILHMYMLTLFTQHHLFYREVFHGHRWGRDPLYQAPMVETSHTQVFLGDFVSTLWAESQNEVITGKVLRFYTKVLVAVTKG